MATVAQGTIRHHMVEVRNGLFSTEVTEAGDATSSPILVLHDLSARRLWAPYLNQLAENYHVIAPAHPGFASSTGIEHIDDPVDMAFYYNDLLDTLDVDSVAVIGHELGGMFAAELAAMSPGRVRKLVLVAPLGLRLQEIEPEDIFAADPATLPAMLWHDPTCPAAQSFDALPEDPSARQEETIFRARAYASASRFVWPFAERGLRKRIHRVRAAALIVWGNSDRFTPPALAKPFLEALSGSQFVAIDNAGHFPMLEQSESFGTAVAAFLGKS